MVKSFITALLALTLAVLLAAPVLAQGRGNDNPGNSGGGGGNSGGNSGNSGNDNRGNSGSSGSSGSSSGQTVQASATPTGTTSTTSASTTPAASVGATATPTQDDGRARGNSGNDNRGNSGNAAGASGAGSSDSHGSAVRDAVQEVRDSTSGPGRGREISDAARSALGKPEQAVVSAEGLLASLSGMSALIVGPAGETAVTLTEETRIKTQDDSDAALADLEALTAAGSMAVRARGRIGSDGSLVAIRLEVRGEADGVTVTLDGVIDAPSATGFTLVTRSAGAPTGTTATTTTAPTGTTATSTTAPTGTTATTTTTVPTGTTATSTVSVGGTYTVIVTADTTIRRNDVTAPLSALLEGDDVEARGTLDGSTLTATRVLADGPAPVGTPATTTSR